MPDRRADPRPDPRPALTEHWPLQGADDLRSALLDAWDRPGYHDLTHLAEVLARLAELRAAGEPFPAGPVLLAAWFHDAVYDGERDAEERSAAWAEDALPDHVDTWTVAEVARLVRLTETHRPTDDDPAGCALSDADLAILAAGEERYAAYCSAVREEYAHLDDDTFRAGRVAVLEGLATKDTLFHTTHARTHWEQPARANLERELAALRAAPLS